jgi:uncharacterized membrane protein
MLGSGAGIVRFVVSMLLTIVATIIVLDWAIGEIRRMWPYLAVGLVVGSGVWLFVLWRRRRDGYYY